MSTLKGRIQELSGLVSPRFMTGIVESTSPMIVSVKNGQLQLREPALVVTKEIRSQNYNIGDFLYVLAVGDKYIILGAKG